MGCAESKSLSADPKVNLGNTTLVALDRPTVLSRFELAGFAMPSPDGTAMNGVDVPAPTGDLTKDAEAAVAAFIGLCGPRLQFAHAMLDCSHTPYFDAEFALAHDFSIALKAWDKALPERRVSVNRAKHLRAHVAVHVSLEEVDKVKVQHLWFRCTAAASGLDGCDTAYTAAGWAAASATGAELRAAAVKQAVAWESAGYTVLLFAEKRNPEPLDARDGVTLVDDLSSGMTLLGLVALREVVNPGAAKLIATVHGSRKLPVAIMTADPHTPALDRTLASVGVDAASIVHVDSREIERIANSVAPVNRPDRQITALLGKFDDDAAPRVLVVSSCTRQRKEKFIEYLKGDRELAPLSKSTKPDPRPQHLVTMVQDEMEEKVLAEPALRAADVRVGIVGSAASLVLSKMALPPAFPVANDCVKLAHFTSDAASLPELFASLPQKAERDAKRKK